MLFARCKYVDSIAGDSEGQKPGKDTGNVQLGPDLWLDLEAGFVLHEDERIPLSIRETKILRVLAQVLRNGRGYLTAEALAERLHLRIPRFLIILLKHLLLAFVGTRGTST